MSKCKKCGADIPDNVKFCPECGTAALGSFAGGSIVMKCRQCNGTLTMEKEGDVLFCPYCGSKELLLDSDPVAVEKIKQQTEFKKWEREDLKEEKKKKEQQEHKYKFGAFGVISIICAVFFGIMALTRFINVVDAWGVFAGIVALIGFLAFVASVMFRRGMIKTDKPYLATVIMIGGFLLFIPFFILNAQIGKTNSSYTSSAREIKEFKWPDSTLAAMLPTPKSKYGEIITDSTDSLWIKVAKTSQSDFDDYISQCKEKGFTENYNRSSTSYTAENKEKYSLDLFYYNNEMSITLDKPKPKTTAAPQATKPTEKETQKPTQKPTQAPTKAPEKPESKPESKSIADTGVVTPSFKEMMDSYEAFFDEYIAFMKKYEANPGDLELLGEYADYISKYSDYLAKLSAVEQDDLSDADLAYYTEVNARILKKMEGI